MEFYFTQAFWTFVGAIATSLMAYFLIQTFLSQKRQLQEYKTEISNHKKQLLLSNFNSIIEFIGNNRTRKNRRIIIKGYNTIKEYLEKYPEYDEDKKLRDFHEACKQVCSSYDRIGFLLHQDEEIKNKIVDWQGFTVIVKEITP